MRLTASIASLVVALLCTPARATVNHPFGAHTFTYAGGSFDDGVRALLVDPSHPATVYAGTRGAGAFRTADGGATWAAINTGMTFGEVRRFTAGPGTPAPIYAGTRQGVFRLYD